VTNNVNEPMAFQSDAGGESHIGTYFWVNETDDDQGAKLKKSACARWETLAIWVLFVIYALKILK